ncbi:MAG: hypothetical protein M1821_001407 [Bathelium mastoideum]|nr:MAG: hypothetical protein M1821_001407 [Bathelium mastoideum]KAI9689935.1 MAG: hypothetical protein M1822_009817 [Bathelium mastoideum]
MSLHPAISRPQQEEPLDVLHRAASLLGVTIDDLVSLSAPRSNYVSGVLNESVGEDFFNNDPTQFSASAYYRAQEGYRSVAQPESNGETLRSERLPVETIRPPHMRGHESGNATWPPPGDSFDATSNFHTPGISPSTQMTQDISEDFSATDPSPPHSDLAFLTGFPPFNSGFLDDFNSNGVFESFDSGLEYLVESSNHNAIRGEELDAIDEIFEAIPTLNSSSSLHNSTMDAQSSASASNSLPARESPAEEKSACNRATSSQMLALISPQNNAAALDRLDEADDIRGPNVKDPVAYGPCRDAWVLPKKVVLSLNFGVPLLR